MFDVAGVKQERKGSAVAGSGKKERERGMGECGTVERDVCLIEGEGGKYV